MSKLSSCDECPSRKVMIIPTTNEIIRMCTNSHFSKNRRIMSGFEIPKWCPMKKEEKES